MNFFTNFLFIVTMVAMFDKTSGCHPTWPSLLQKIENYCQKTYIKIGKKSVATKLYGNDAYTIHFQTYGC
jgi:hypothetical protein